MITVFLEDSKDGAAALMWNTILELQVSKFRQIAAVGIERKPERGFLLLLL